MKTLFAAVLATFALTAGAFAADLTTDVVTRFVDTLAPTNAFGEELDRSGKLDRLIADDPPVLGERFAPYSDGMADLKKTLPGEYARFGAMLKGHGFASPEAWGEVGDRVMLAYMALELEREDPNAFKEMGAMDPKMLDMVPPAMRAQLEGALALVATVRDVPPADKKAVKPLVDRIRAELDAQDE